METKDNKIKRYTPSPFSIILSMITCMIIGIAMIPMLNVRYTPSLKQHNLSISYSWRGASAKVVEQEVTSKLEGVLASVRGIKQMNSTSRKGGGTISLTFKNKESIDVIRFEIATLIKQIYPQLPKQVSYPSFSTTTSGERPQTLISYRLNAPLTTQQIKKYAEEILVPALSEIDGVGTVRVSGATPYEWEIRFDPNKCAVLGISASEIEQAINTYNKESILGLSTEKTIEGDTIEMRVMLINTSKDMGQEAGHDRTKGNTVTGYEIWDNIPITNKNGRIITLKDIATVQYKQQLPSTYYRINGLNNINLSITAEKNINTLKVAHEIKEKMQELQTKLPENYSVLISADASKEIKKELNKIYLRMIMSTLILLAFVYLVSRKLRYLFLITITLIANILISFIFYNLFNLEIHLYSMAGITVSLGLIIDTSIIMIDHYSYYKNLKAFLAVFAALLTTIGALVVVFFLPENEKANLVDFSLVIIINLTVSLLIALFFIPALLDKLPINPRRGKKMIKIRRRVVRFTRLYDKFILFIRKKKIKWIFIVLIILAFGIPIHMLPAKLKDPQNKNKDREGFFPELYNKTIGGQFYQNKLKTYLEPALGGALRLFMVHTYNTRYNVDPERTRLYIRASMPDGCTVHQLNETVLKMENFLSQYDEIEMYETSITSNSNGNITVTFTPEVEDGAFPHLIRDILISKATDLGGADWRITGVGRGFSNALGSSYKSNQIIMSGYNYDLLYGYAEQLIDTLLQNKRVSDPEILGGENLRTNNTVEYFIDFNFENFAKQDLNPYDYYNFLRQQLFSTTLNPVMRDGIQTPVTLVSQESEDFDVWHLANDIITMKDKSVKLSDLGTIQKRYSGNNIIKTNQIYTLTIAYDFLGPYELNTRVRNRSIDNMNDILPLGFKAYTSSYYGRSGSKQQYMLLFLIIAIIYMICAILFESLWQPFVIIVMIPISFIGVFLTFYLFKFRFDQGGFASFVLLCGIVVNAGIYIINEYNLTCRAAGRQGLKYYLKSYNHKIIPIFLTIVSTILGLIPFVYSGQREPFWFSFAVGAMGGMVFSFVALFIYMPMFMKFKDKKTTKKLSRKERKKKKKEISDK